MFFLHCNELIIRRKLPKSEGRKKLISYVFFFYIRPRRFGKSLTISMLEHYYDINEAGKFEELYGKLYIGQNPTPERNKYLVIKLNFSVVNAELHDYKRGLDNHCRIAFNYFCDVYAQYLPAGIKQGMNELDSAVAQLNYICNECRKTGAQIYLFIDDTTILPIRFLQSQIV